MVRRTAGTFDLTQRPAYFTASTEHIAGRWNLVAVNDLDQSWAERRLAELLDAGHQVLLDSGIFWLTNRHARDRGVSMDEALRLAPEDIDGFTELHARYLDLTNRFGDRLWGYIELDQGGRENKKRTRAGLEAAGLAPIPVYHPLVDGWSYFDELAQQYDRICFGNIVQADHRTRLRLLHTLWERHRAYPDLWVHVLGLTANPWCLALPVDSCDSSSWLAPLRWNHQRVESALLARLGDLPPEFRYRHGDRGSYLEAVALCADAANAMTRCWQHAAHRHDLEEPYPHPHPSEPGRQRP